MPNGPRGAWQEGSSRQKPPPLLWTVAHLEGPLVCSLLAEVGVFESLLGAGGLSLGLWPRGSGTIHSPGLSLQLCHRHCFQGGGGGERRRGAAGWELSEILLIANLCYRPYVLGTAKRRTYSFCFWPTKPLTGSSICLSVLCPWEKLQAAAGEPQPLSQLFPSQRE